jgi:hypothetical protein
MNRALLVAATLVALVGCSSSSTSSSSTSTDSTTTTATGTGTGTGTTTATGTGGSGGGAAGGACTNAADTAIRTADEAAFQKKISDCATTFVGQEQPTKDCIKEKTALSDACTECFGDVVLCAAEKCLTDCMADQNGKPCSDCRAANCDPAFVACSGIKP